MQWTPKNISENKLQTIQNIFNQIEISFSYVIAGHKIICVQPLEIKAPATLFATTPLISLGLSGFEIDTASVWHIWIRSREFTTKERFYFVTNKDTGSINSNNLLNFALETIRSGNLRPITHDSIDHRFKLIEGCGSKDYIAICRSHGSNRNLYSPLAKTYESIAWELFQDGKHDLATPYTAFAAAMLYKIEGAPPIEALGHKQLFDYLPQKFKNWKASDWDQEMQVLQTLDDVIQESKVFYKL